MMRKSTFLLVIAFVLTACSPKTETPLVQVTPALMTATETLSAPAGDQGSSPAATEVPPTVEQTASLPLEPQEVNFQASDGQGLSGYYYPSAINPSPLVVLMHWAGGDMSDWYEIALWLQNRDQVNPFVNPGAESWWDPTWFIEFPAELSYGVFIFTFRGCLPAKDCPEFLSEAWLLDAQAGILTGAGLKGVDPGRVVAMGSSIGADGAPDACAWINQQSPGSCRGALSLSPGHHLTVPYPAAVQWLGEVQSPVPAWCLADEREYYVCEMAEDSGNPEYRDFLIPGGQHGNLLLRPGLDPLPMQIILDFLDKTLAP